MNTLLNAASGWRVSLADGRGSHGRVAIATRATAQPPRLVVVATVLITTRNGPEAGCGVDLSLKGPRGREPKEAKPSEKIIQKKEIYETPKEELAPRLALFYHRLQPMLGPAFPSPAAHA